MVLNISHGGDRSLRAEDGVALVATMMVMLLLLSSLLAGFTAMTVSESRMGALDAGGADAFYAAHAGLEKLTSDLGVLFNSNYAPSGDAVRALGDAPPSLGGVTWQKPDGSDGYLIEFETTTGDPATGDPVAVSRTVTEGPYAGLLGYVTEYSIDTTAHLDTGSESGLERVFQSVSLPVFQFGIFSETDLSFFPGSAFSFGGRVHTNGNLFLAAAGSLTMTDKVSAVGEVVRAYLANGLSTASRTGPIDIVTTPGNYRDLLITEGSVTGDEHSATNEPTWTNLSTGAYNSNLLNSRTGARRLDLPITTLGADAIDLVRRPAAGEDPLGTTFPQRRFAIASIRILLSDTSADITSLPTVTQTPAIRLDDQVDTGGDPDNPWPGYVVGPTTPPLARSSGDAGQGYRFPLDDTSLGGFIKIEIQSNLGNWTDVTNEILNLGIAGRSLSLTCPQAPVNPNAVIRIQRLRHDGNFVEPGPFGCGQQSTSGYDYWPLVLYDAREGNFRDDQPTANTTMFLSGLMHYVELDVNNLRRWLSGSIGVSGPNALDQDGFVVYFSDRRGNRDGAGNETGELGFEDFVNPASLPGTPSGVLDIGEDVNGNGVLDVYGNVPQRIGAAPLDGTATLRTLVPATVAQVNPPVFFRRALKLVNGGLTRVPMPGFTLVSENPVYVQGDFNAYDPMGFIEPSSNASIIADAVTLLSSSWTDLRSLTSPHDPVARPASTSWYRVAIISGKGRAFPRPTGALDDFGTDGGTHNFLRMLERWSGETLNYRGSMVTFFDNRQALGTYKCCANVYGAPTRAFGFETNFLDPARLPPATPVFHDMNILGFTYNQSPGM